jgi:putative pyruvate formate lyase activating enzyme
MMDWESRIKEVEKIMRSCTLCEFGCQADRFEGQTGLCKLSADTYYVRDFINIWQELGPVPCYTILFNGCYFECPYCILGNILQHPQSGFLFQPEDFATRIKLLYENGINNIFFLGGEPLVHLLSLFNLLKSLPSSIKKNLYSYLYIPPKILELITDSFDLFLAEYRYGNDQCAIKYSSAKDYTNIIQRNLLYLNTSSKIIVRHLLLPGHMECCYRPLVDWLANNLPQVKFSLGNEYIPTYKAHYFPEINRRIRDEEYQVAVSMAQERGLELIYRYLPSRGSI